jgi:ADP-ribose pyrophosphatase YjhB (NUDIX family)
LLGLRTELLIMRRSSGILHKYKDKVLLCKRSEESETLGKFWSIPGGGWKKNESSQAAALREFYEETNINISDPLIYVGTSVHKNEDGSGSKLDVFMVEASEMISPELENAKDGFEHSECGYFEIDKLPSPMPRDLINIIKKIN